MIDVALYQPDIPQNVGAALRLCACLGVRLNIIEPCAFPWNEKKIRLSAMDYITKADYKRFSSWQDFNSQNPGRRIILMTTKTAEPYTDFQFQAGDILLAGSESSGVPEDIHNAASARVTIPLRPGLRSLNVINATAMILGEALRQTREIKA
ncbi:MAG: tRNA (cytidine(34)-2'-O)-methyltransferase [Alphaproteobacteria bacterium]|nr:tRNA (cytidine(34)-2'-O)-methyltransferase [Alphaproteobacteria bacterium]